MTKPTLKQSIRAADINRFEKRIEDIEKDIFDSKLLIRKYRKKLMKLLKEDI